MFAKSKFLQTIVQHINHDTAAQPELITCLKVITNQLGLTIHPAAFDKLELHAFMQANHFSGPLGMLITSINQPCPSQLAKTYFPLLIQDQYGNYLVYLKKKCGKYLVFDAALNREISLNARELAAKLVQVWQCSPICPELITGIKKLVKYFTKTFTSQVITILFASLIFSLLNSSMTAAASYFIANIGLMNQSWLAANYLPIPLFFLVMGMLVYSNGILQNSLTTRIITRVLPAIWQQLLSQTLSVLRQFTTGDMTQRLADYELALTSAIPILLSMIFSIFTLLLLFLFMAYLNTSLTWCYLIIACFFLAIKLFLIPLNVKHMQAECKMQGKVTGYLNEVFLQIHKIRASHAEASIYNKWLSFWVELKAQSEQLMMFK
jgi:ABC-type bacteriocin/lantibiotic exporter with double-glycine peptidase domain